MLTTAQTADSSLKTIYEQQTIYFDGSTNKYVKNNQKKKSGHFGKKLNQEFENSSAEAKQEMGMFMKNEKRAVLFATAALVIVVVTAVIAPEITFVAAIVGVGVGLASYTTGVINLIKAPRHLHKAVWLHNRDIITKK